ncbi:hypothetical protein C8R45DRAFT_1022382 [Mycena sanguinolenta]|nr:hypothetical protein C8R45DRAFT_1022382 [Mycena sanguinolenta]
MEASGRGSGRRSVPGVGGLEASGRGIGARGTLKHEAYLRETLAYRHLHSLQGSIIPHLHGTVRLPISQDSCFLHPIVDLVDGFALEYIASPTMDDLKVGVDITPPLTEEISTRLLHAVTAIRDAYCHHNDLHLGNVVFRNWPHNPRPVVIDFRHGSWVTHAIFWYFRRSDGHAEDPELWILRRLARTLPAAAARLRATCAIQRVRYYQFPD